MSVAVLELTESSEPSPGNRAKALARANPANRVMVPKLERLLDEICVVFAVAPEAVRRHDRHASPAAARAAFWWLSRKLFGFSFPELGRLIGDDKAWDHTSVMAACSRVDRDIRRQNRNGLMVEGFLLGRANNVVTVPGEGNLLVLEEFGE